MACTPCVFIYGKRDGSYTYYIFMSLIQTQGHVVRREQSKIVYIYTAHETGIDHFTLQVPLRKIH